MMVGTQPSRQQLDAQALAFLGSEFAGRAYAEWPIERRLQAFLKHQGLERGCNGAAFDVLLQRVMGSFARARRAGLLGPLTNH